MSRKLNANNIITPVGLTNHPMAGDIDVMSLGLLSTQPSLGYQKNIYSSPYNLAACVGRRNVSFRFIHKNTSAKSKNTLEYMNVTVSTAGSKIIIRWFFYDCKIQLSWLFSL